jgi:hypothetical protein
LDVDSGVETGGGAEGAGGGAGVGAAGVGVVAGAGVVAGVGAAWDGAAGVESLEELLAPQPLSAAIRNRNVTSQNALRAFEPYPMPPFHI